MATLSGYQRRFLRGVAHARKPAVLVGKEGLSQGVVDAIDASLTAHELIKVKFNDYKAQKTELSQEISTRTQATQVDLIGNTLVLYKQSPYPEKRRIKV